MKGHASWTAALARGLASVLVAGGVVWMRSPIVGASSAPTAPSTDYQVTSSWGDTVSFNGQPVLYAYQEGYEATPGSPSGDSVIILDFFRQVMQTNNGVTSWGVDIGSTGFEPDSWVEEVATAFINGYSDGHSSSAAASIAIGTANDNYNWTCDESTGNVSSNWASAGADWGNVLLSLPSSPNNVVLVTSADDFESWIGTFSDGWTACGLGAEDWLNAFQNTVDPSGGAVNVNYGTDANAEDSSQWTSGEVYDVSFTGDAQAMPEVYCSGQPSEWADVSTGTYVSFWGVTSENGAYFGSGCNGNTSTDTYTWSEAWNALESVLTTQSLYPAVDDY